MYNVQTITVSKMTLILAMFSVGFFFITLIDVCAHMLHEDLSGGDQRTAF